jgi:tRNA dimethylallyltransferase
VGPTGSGKSECAVRLAKKIGGEIISADSRQIYRGLDIGSAKVKGSWRGARRDAGGSKNVFVYKNIPHFCIDYIPPKRTFTVQEFARDADRAIRDILGRGKIPLLAGGSGFWADAVGQGLALPPVPPNLRLRKTLEKHSVQKLYGHLLRLDPRRAKTIDSQNPRRLIRAIEAAKVLGRVAPLRATAPYRAFWIGMAPDGKELRKRIYRRALLMIRQGLAEETKSLLAAGVSKKRIREFGFEYRAALDYGEKRIDRHTFLTELSKATWRYAKRQMTYWRRNKKIRWVRNCREAESSIKHDFKTRKTA